MGSESSKSVSKSVRRGSKSARAASESKGSRPRDRLSDFSDALSPALAERLEGMFESDIAPQIDMAIMEAGLLPRILPAATDNPKAINVEFRTGWVRFIMPDGGWFDVCTEVRPDVAGLHILGSDPFGIQLQVSNAVGLMPRGTAVP